MTHLNPYKQWLGDLMPALVMLMAVGAVTDAVTKLDFKPLGEWAGILVESIFE